jgi:hypothetical protein
MKITEIISVHQSEYSALIHPSEHHTHYHYITYQVLFYGEGPRNRFYGRTSALRLIVQPCGEDDSFFVFPCNGAPVE